MALTQTPEEGLKVSNAPSNGQFLQYKDSTDKLTWAAAGAGTMSNLVEDTTPQLGGHLDLNGTNTITNSDSNNPVEITVAGDQDILLKPGVTGGLLIVGSANEAATICSNHAQDLVLRTHYDSTDTGTFTITDGSNGDITIAPHGTGDVNLDADTVRVGDNNADVAITTQGTGDLTLSTNGGTNSGTIEIEDGANNDIVLTPNGSGDVILDGLKYPQADGSADQVLKTDGSAQLSWTTISGGVSSDAQLNTVGGTNSGDSFDGSNAAENTLYGYDTGTAITTGDYNTFIGSKCGDTNTTGNYNTGVGRTALTSLNGGGNENTAVGVSALYNNTTADYNVAIGRSAGYSITTGENNTIIGTYAGDAINTGGSNTVVGYNAFGASSGNGNMNVCIGENSGTTLGAVSQNVMVGYEAGKLLDSGLNTCVGHQAGSTWSSAANDYEMCAIGRQAGRNQTGGWGKLFIAHRDHAPGAAAVWIYGTSAGECTQGNNSSSWTTTSDRRLKKNIVDNNVGLSAIDQLQVRNFEYRTDDEIDRSEFPLVQQGKWTKEDEDAGLGTEGEWKQTMQLGHTGTQIGVIAQELEAVLPDCVTTDDRGVKTVDSDEIMWHMLTAIKELSAKVKALEAG